MQYEPLSELYQVALMATALVVPLAGALVRRRDSLFDSKLASELQEIQLNVMLAMIIVMLGLSATLITPILPSLGLERWHSF